jgi:glycosyltransferase involved in cell wall biosynthesis
MEKKKPLVTIIIAVYNSGYLFPKTIKSLLNQTYTNIEVIVVDGNSEDQSYIKPYLHQITSYVSEPDLGIYDAWNKGIAIAKGSWIGFLGCGDCYYEDAIESYIWKINGSKDLEYLSSEVEMVNESGSVIMVKGSAWEWPKFLNFMNTAHVGSLHSVNLFKKYGIFNINYKIAGDYELLMRPKQNLKAEFLPKTTVKMLIGGKSYSYKIIREDFKLKTETGKLSKPKAFSQLLINYIKISLKFIFYRFGINFNIRK